MKRPIKKERRIFSTAFKMEKVQLLDQGKITVRDLCDLYHISTSAVYKWINKYSELGPGERIVVEKISEETKTRELLNQIKELEGVIGRKQMELDYYKTAIEVINEAQGEDVLKKYKPK